MGNTFGKQFWTDLKAFVHEYWVEVAIFFVFVTLMFVGVTWVF
jgi:hypothetical protein